MTEVEREDKTAVFTWRVENFSSLLDQRGRIDTVGPVRPSGLFDFCGGQWKMYLYPKYWCDESMMGYVVLSPSVIYSGPPRSVRYSVGIRTAEGVTEVCGSGTETLDRSPASIWVRVMRISELLRRRDELLPRNVLTLTLELTVPDGSSATGAVERNVADASVQTAVEESVSCGIRDEPSEKRGVYKIVEDVGKLWPNGDHTDVVLKVKNVEFKVHRTILAARTPVLGAMFHHNTIEKASGEARIDDCEPEVFEQLLHYVYKGAPRELTAENAPALYVLADKYLVSEAKALCVRCMGDTLCLDTFCDTLTMSLMHREDELLERSTEFLSRNMIDVMKTDKWQRFLREHPTWANEITIRATELTAARYEKRKRARLDLSML